MSPANRSHSVSPDTPSQNRLRSGVKSFIFSIPPATTTSACPLFIAIHASLKAKPEDAHAFSTLRTGLPCIPECSVSSAAVLPNWPPPNATLPMNASSICLG